MCFIGAKATIEPMKTYSWYVHLKKPTWAPPAWLFGPVWSALYVVIALSFGTVFWMALQEQISWHVAQPFVLNLLFNVLFTPVQFGLRSNAMAAVDVLAVWVTLVWCMVIIFPIAPWIAYAQIPYLLWVSFATVLQLTITVLNRKHSPYAPLP